MEGEVVALVASDLGQGVAHRARGQRRGDALVERAADDLGRREHRHLVLEPTQVHAASTPSPGEQAVTPMPRKELPTQRVHGRF